MGKVPMGVLRHAKGIPVALLSGRIENRALLEQAGFSPIMEVTPRSLSLSEALQAETARHYLRAACTKLL
jgi:glycerate kinase